MLNIISSMLLAGISCQPDLIFPNQVLSIELQAHHRGENQLLMVIPEENCFSLAIKTPDGRYLVAFDPYRNIHGQSFPNSREPGSYPIDIGKAEAADASSWPIHYEPIFTEPGRYIFYFADNLETEPENTLHSYEEIRINPLEKGKLQPPAQNGAEKHL